MLDLSAGIHLQIRSHVCLRSSSQAVADVAVVVAVAVVAVVADGIKLTKEPLEAKICIADERRAGGSRKTQRSFCIIRENTLSFHLNCGCHT